MDSADHTPVPVVVLTGPVGVGKTSVASALSDLLNDHGLAHAVVDMDWLRWCNPAPPHDRFNETLGLKNLALVWASYREAGAARLIVADVVEHPDTLAAYRRAVPGAALTLVRLRATLPTLHARLAGREQGANLEWHRDRAAVLAAQMERDAIEDWALDTDDAPAAALALEIGRRLGWLPQPMR
jgi:chloramphenicol 3-O-phosphotransferase